MVNIIGLIGVWWIMVGFILRIIFYNDSFSSFISMIIMGVGIMIILFSLSLSEEQEQEEERPRGEDE